MAKGYAILVADIEEGLYNEGYFGAMHRKK
jgi:hypothetical protein